jgi:hypothetical protein
LKDNLIVGLKGLRDLELDLKGKLKAVMKMYERVQTRGSRDKYQANTRRKRREFTTASGLRTRGFQ